MQNIKVFIIVFVFVDFPVIFLILFFYCLIMAAAYPTLCCYSLNGFDRCVPGCVTLATLVSVRGTWLNTFVYLKRQHFPYFLKRTKVTYPYNQETKQVTLP